MRQKQLAKRNIVKEKQIAIKRNIAKMKKKFDIKKWRTKALRNINRII